jgi:hypothetical protein
MEINSDMKYLMGIGIASGLLNDVWTDSRRVSSLYF